MLKFFIKRRKQRDLCRAICDRNLQQIQKLVDDDLDLNFVKWGSSPLSLAIWTADRKIIDFLIARGASPSKAGNDGILVGAVCSEDHDLIDLALTSGHDIHFRGRNSATALETAAFRNKPETIKYLVARGATKDDFNVEKCSWRSINSSTIKALLDLGVKVPSDIVESVKSGDWF